MKEMRAVEKEAELDVEDTSDDDLPDQDTTPGEFLYFGLEIEHQQ